MKNAMTPKFRVSYPNVFKAKKNELSGKEEYYVVALFPKNADLTQLKLAAQAAAEEKWGKDKSKWPTNLRLPFRDQAEMAKNGALPQGCEAGAIFVRLKSTQKPGIVDENVQDIIDESQFYPGCYARASVRAFAYDNVGNRGISFGLNNIQKMGEGETLGSRIRPQEEFAPIQVQAPESANDLFN